MRVRRPSGDRKPVGERDHDLVPALETLVEPATRGDLESPLRWTIENAREIGPQNHPVSHATMPTLLERAGVGLRSNRKTREGGSHPDRDARSESINKRVGDR